ncbi:MAG TPA: hypothetical protein VGF67_30660 [Ktedonobacteraceae bacterium]|jgi:hypothetical protein
MKNDETLTFHHLVYNREGEEVTVGRPDRASYAVFPADGAALLQQLQAGLSPAAASCWYQQTYGELPDMDAFLHTLQSLHFLRKGVQGADEQAPALAWQWTGRAMFSPYAWLLYLALFAWCFVDLVRFPDLRPGYHAIFFSPYLTLVEIVLLLGQIPAILLHECYHILAAQRIGVPSRLSLGRRFYFVVIQTSLDGLWGVPRKARYLPFLAGMLADLLVVALLTVTAGLSRTAGGTLTAPGQICIAFTLPTLVRFLWQFNLYLRTDVYYVCANLCKCIDLHATTRRYLRNQWFRLRRRPEKMEDTSLWNPRDRQVARWYAPVMVAGYLAATVLGVLALWPLLSQVVGELLRHLFVASAAFHPDLFWDAFLALFLNGLQIIVVTWLFLRERQARRVSRLP